MSRDFPSIHIISFITSLRLILLISVANVVKKFAEIFLPTKRAISLACTAKLTHRYSLQLVQVNGIPVMRQEETKRKRKFRGRRESWMKGFLFLFPFVARDLRRILSPACFFYYSLRLKIITHIEFKICSKNTILTQLLQKSKSFRRFFIKETRHYLNFSHKNKKYFSNFTSYISLHV